MFDTREVKKKDGHRQVNLRAEHDGTNVVAIVGLDGWHFSKTENRNPDRWGRSTRGKNVRLSMNSPLTLTMEEFEEMVDEIRIAYYDLEEGLD